MIPRSTLAQACLLLNEHEAHYVLVGGLAVQLWGSTRATQDIDLLIEPTVENARRVLDAVVTLTGSWGLARDLLAEDVAKRAVTIIGDTPNVDILTRAWNVRWAQANPRATTFVVEGVKVPTASIEDLIESKQTGRLQDAADIEVLEEIRRQRDA